MNDVDFGLLFKPLTSSEGFKLIWLSACCSGLVIHSLTLPCGQWQLFNWGCSKEVTLYKYDIFDTFFLNIYHIKH